MFFYQVSRGLKGYRSRHPSCHCTSCGKFNSNLGKIPFINGEIQYVHLNMLYSDIMPIKTFKMDSMKTIFRVT